MRVAVIGLGEAGSLYASGFAAKGWAVTGFDPADNLTPEGVSRFADVAEAVAGSDLVLSLVGGKAALRAAAAAAPHLPATALFADMNAAPAALKRKIAATVAAESGVLFADVSVLGSVPTYGAQAPLVVSGAGSTRAAELFDTIGAPVEDIAGEPGDASSRKLLRSSFMKGLGALIVESVAIGRAAGAEDWVREQIANELATGPAAVDRLYSGTVKHADRRATEADGSVTLADELGVRAVVGRATAEIHHALADQGKGSGIVDDLLEAYQGLPVANIGDARDRMGMVDSGIHALWKGAKAVGRARTVWVREGDNQAIHEVVNHVQPGDIVVINGHGDTNRALLGELIAEKLRVRGAAGLVVDGAIRDIDILEEMSFPVWARAVTPSGPYKTGPGKINIPVAVGGVVVNPGDIICADSDGVIVIPGAEAVSSLLAGRAVETDEAQRRAAIIASVTA
jgi:4-hydroxy-4-methyl-2-oxoglutarate aldolase